MDPAEAEEAREVSHPSGFAYANEGWRSEYLPQRISRFTLEYSLYPFEATRKPIDVVLGLSNGPADAFTDLGPIVRLNPSGFFDARDGSTYRALAPVPYRTAGEGEDAIVYGVRMDVDVPNRVYSVWITPPNSAPIQIASGFRFRTEQATLARIDQIAAFVDSPTGTILFHAATVTPPWCVTSNGTSGWVGTPFPLRSGAFYVETDITAQQSTLDAVIGLSRGAPTRFTDLGPIVRLNPAGYFDARDGSTYRYSMYAPVTPGFKHQLFMLVDMTTRTYSAHVTIPNGSWPEIAAGFKFRTEQANATAFDHLGQFIDGTPGSMRTCDLLNAPYPYAL